MLQFLMIQPSDCSKTDTSVMQAIKNERSVQIGGIRDTVIDFLKRCGIDYPREVLVNTAFYEDCHDECIRRGYDMEIFSPFLRVGIDVAATGYIHLEDKRIPRYIAIYTGFMTFLDDFCQTENGMSFISSFIYKFTHNEPHEHKILDDVANIFKEANLYWRPITASIIISSSLRYISSLFLDHETKGMQLSGKAIRYPTFLRMLSGDPESYSVFAFPPDMPTSHYVQALPYIMDITNHINDILSFYKEELQGEQLNYISLVGESHGLEKLEALQMISRSTAISHLHALDLLTGEAYKCYKAYSEGYVAFHVLCDRYRLAELCI